MSVPPKEFWPWWFFIPAGHTWVATPLVLVVLVTLAYGVTLTHSAIRHRSSWREMLAGSYDFWLGQSFLGDWFFRVVLVLAVITGDDVDLWVALLFIFITFPVGMAFKLWLQARQG